jgi:uncharacterized membrane protein
MTFMRRNDWMIPAGLVLLSIIPAVGGLVRMQQLAQGAAGMTPDNARFFTSPVLIIAHVMAAIPFALLGAFQFWPTFRKKNRVWHRGAGRLLVLLGLVVAITGLWMTLAYPWAPNDGLPTYVERLVFGSIMLFSMLMGIDAIRRRNFKLHGEWMLRAYAVGMGAGTQVITHVPFFLLVGQPGVVARGWLMGSAWVINLVIAEWLILRMRAARVTARPPRNARAQVFA